jgi:hypothetical protein
MGFKVIKQAQQTTKFTPIHQAQKFTPVASAPKFTPLKPQQGFFGKAMDQLVKPVSMASNAVEDMGKTLAFPLAKLGGYQGSWEDAKKSQGIDFLGHQKQVLNGEQKRTYSDITRDAFKNGSKAQQIAGQVVGYGGDFLLDPLNKVKIAALTAKGLDAAKIGKLSLSAAEQAAKGERALLQFGKFNILPKVGNKVLEGSSKLNDVVRGTETGGKIFDAGAAVSSKIRPGGVSRGEFKILTDAKSAARNTVGYTTDKAIEFAKNLAKTLTDRKATDSERAYLLHAIEKGDSALAPAHLQDVFEAGTQFKNANNEAWKTLGGSVLEGHGLSHVATKEVADAARKDALKGGKIFSPITPQDAHREWMKVNGKITNIKDAGIKYKDGVGFVKKGEKEVLSDGAAEITNAKNYQKNLVDNAAKERQAMEESLQGGQTIKRNSGEAGYEQYGGSMNLKRISEHSAEYRKYFKEHGSKPPLSWYRSQIEKEISSGNHSASDEYKAINDYINSVKPGEAEKITAGWVPAKVEQASAMEINNAVTGQGKKAIFQEDLPIVAAKMGISTGKKQAGVEFLKATAGLTGETAKKLAGETYEKMTNNEALNKAVESFDAIQNIWKAQALVAPSYHIRNFAGNLWNNFLADVKTPAYALAANLQNAMRTGKLSEAQNKLVQEMEKHGVIGTGQYGGDIAKTISNEVGASSFNPLSQKFGGYRLNKWIGSGVEDNAKIAHFLSKRAEGYGTKEAADSVKKYLFDYGDLTNVERGLFKRVLPFYTWTSKNLPLQIQQFVENPGKFSKIATTKKDFEQGVAQPNEKYMSDYIKSNAPVRVKTDENGNTMYFLLGQWLPAASAINFLSQPLDNTLGMVSPLAKLPYENLTNQGTFFKDTMGNYENIQKFPGQKTSYLGLDLSPQTVNNLRSIRPLNELDKLNPGNIFGSKNSPSIFQGIFDNASNQRGGKYTPETSQGDRISNSFVGKLNAYSSDDSKKYYDRDTQTKITEYKTAIDRALSNNQVDMAKGLIQEMAQFTQERDGQPNKDIQMYNLLGDRYFQDQAQNKQAEKNRDSIREDMRKQIRQGLASKDYNIVNEALKKDPTYAKSALKDAIGEKAQAGYSPEQQKMIYEVEQLKNKYNLKSFY